MRKTFALFFMLLLAVGCSQGPTLKPGAVIIASDVQALQFAPDSLTLAVAAKDPTVSLVDVDSGRERGKLSGHTSSIVGLAYSADSKMLATASTDGTVKVWNPDQQKLLTTLKPGGSAVAFRPDGKRMAVGSDGTIRVYQTDTWKLFKEWRESDGAISTLAFSEDGKKLAAGTPRGLKLYDADAGNQLAAHVENNQPVKAIAFAGDQDLMAYYQGYGVVLLRADGSSRATHPENGTVGFSSDGKRAVVASAALSTLIKDTETWKDLGSTKLALGSVNAVSMSKDGKMAAVAGIKDITVLKLP